MKPFLFLILPFYSLLLLLITDSMQPFLLSLLPLLLLIFSLGILKIPPRYTAFFSLLLTIFIAVLFFNQNLFLISMSLLEGVSFTVWSILIILFAALFSYNFIIETGRINIIKRFIFSFSEEKSVLVLILVWGIGNLLEGVAGFGTPIIIPVRIMITLGFNPFFSVFICLLANTVSSAFGAVGIPVITLSIIADADPNITSAFTALQVFPITIITPFILVLLTEKSFKKALNYLPETLAASFGFSMSFLLTAFFLGPELPLIIGSLVAIASVIIMSSLRKKVTKSLQNKNNCIESKKVSAGEVINAFSVYFFILVFIILASPIFPEIKKILDLFSSRIKFYPGDNGRTVTFYWLNNPGILILLAVILVGYIDFLGEKKSVFLIALNKTFKTIASSSISLMLFTSIAMVMRYSGMAIILAEQISIMTGSLFPLFSPFVGALGGFITGGSTASGILLGGIQKYVAINLGINEYWLISANLSGASVGKILSPFYITVALSSATGLSGQESKLFNKVIPCYMVFLIILGVITFFFSDISDTIVSIVKFIQHSAN